ncbi:DUF1800 domain-containing protein [bacterium]|nr:MAG: DUF1800 domain-containing protein [bacterium]
MALSAQRHLDAETTGPTMSPRDRIRHLYRRLGFGATPSEVDEAVKLGFEATRKRLVEFEKTPMTDDVSPYEFVWREKEEPDLGTWRFGIWWALRMVTTPRPLQEKLALFWHDHFAVSENKVENGMMMLPYLRTLQEHAGGRFSNLLKAVSKEPAMMKFLDMNRQIRGVPNENFAREVMELFTLGIGNYTEEDVQAASRAFTGWGYNEIFWELPGTTESKFRDSLKFDRPFAAFYYSPAMHDPSPKKILGKTAPFDGDSLLEMLAEHPQTARYVCGKLWAYFAYDDPEPAVLNALVGTWKRTHGNITAIVDEITRRPEFYSDKCVRSRVKSPVDLIVGVARAMGLDKSLLRERAKDATELTALAKRPFDVAGEVMYHFTRTGMQILYPPDVAGWDWGTAWTSAALMAERMKFRGVALWREKGVGEGAQGVYDALAPLAPKTTEELAARFVELFDVPLAENRLKPIVEALNRGGGVKALEKPESTAGLIYHALPVLMAAPETHLC